MSEERWVSLSPEEFDQLQKYSEYSSKKIKDVLTEFNEGGSLKQHDPHKIIMRITLPKQMRPALQILNPNWLRHWHHPKTQRLQRHGETLMLCLQAQMPQWCT